MTGNSKDQGGASDQIAEHSESEGRVGRRALLAGAAAAGVGVAAAVVSRPGAASAADGSPLLLGDAVANAASTLTTVTTTGAGGLVWNSSATDTTAITGADTASSGGYGVQGTSTSGIGVYGESSSSDTVHDGAVVGYNGSGGNALVGKVNGSTAGAQAVLGSDTTTVAGSYGVAGESTNGIGVYGESSSSDTVHNGAVVGYNGSGGNALVGKVNGSTAGAQAVLGSDTTTVAGSYGVAGESTNGIGVYGESSSSDTVHNGAVVGYNGSGGNALVGKVNGSTAGAQAVLGSDTTTVAGSYGVAGESTNGYGVVARGGLAPLILIPSSTTGAPTTGTHSLGGLYVDSAGNLWLCVASGNPGQWRMIQGPATAGAFHAITPARVYDSRVEGAKTKTTNGTTYTVTVANEINDTTGAVATANVVPPGATAIVANLTITQTVAAGYLTVTPSGGHSTSSINWTAANQSIANGLTVGISSSRTVSVYSDGSTHFILDVTGYYL